MQSHVLARYLLEKAQARESVRRSMPALQPCGLKASALEEPYSVTSSKTASLHRRRKQKQQQGQQVEESRDDAKDKEVGAQASQQQQQNDVSRQQQSVRSPGVRRVYEQAMPAPGISVTVQQERNRLTLPAPGNNSHALAQHRQLQQLQEEQQREAAAQVVNREHYVPVNIQPHTLALPQHKARHLSSFAPAPPPVPVRAVEPPGVLYHSAPEVPQFRGNLPVLGNPHHQALAHYPGSPRPKDVVRAGPVVQYPGIGQAQESPYHQAVQHPGHVHPQGNLQHRRDDPLYDSGLCMCPPGATTHTDGSPVHPQPVVTAHVDSAPVQLHTVTTLAAAKLDKAAGEAISVHPVLSVVETSTASPDHPCCADGHSEARDQTGVGPVYSGKELLHMTTFHPETQEGRMLGAAGDISSPLPSPPPPVVSPPPP